MIEWSLGATTAIVCAFLYWGTIVVLIYYNSKRWEVVVVTVFALLVWPCLLLGSVTQLLFLVPLYTVILRHGLTIPPHIPLATAVRAILYSILAAAACLAALMWWDGAAS